MGTPRCDATSPQPCVPRSAHHADPRTRYPDLLQELLDSGARMFGFEDGLPPTLRPRLCPARRRRRALDPVQPAHDAGARHAPLCGALARRDVHRRSRRARDCRRTATHRAALHVDGLKVERDGAVRRNARRRDVDASGRNTPFPGLAARAKARQIARRRKPRRHSLFHAALPSARRRRRAAARRDAGRRRSRLHQVRRVPGRQPAFLGDAGGAGNRDRAAPGDREAGDFRRDLRRNSRLRALDRSARAASRRARCSRWAI